MAMVPLARLAGEKRKEQTIGEKWDQPLLRKYRGRVSGKRHLGN